jgi:hypothetical protein
MKSNLGTLDRVIRVFIGLVLITGADNGRLGLWAWIGVLPILTALVSFCPLYSIFGVATCKAVPAPSKSSKKSKK